jgi:MFS family permease
MYLITQGPVIGPVAGGFAAEYLGWRWTFWLVAIMVRHDLFSQRSGIEPEITTIRRQC